jgi:cbb3-type cytochrome c oxidase subunit I
VYWGYRLTDHGYGAIPVITNDLREEATMATLAMDDTTDQAQDSLTNRRLIRAWVGWGLVWLTIFPLVGLLVAIKFHNPGFLDSEPWLTFGRLRPVHVNGVIFGAFGTIFLGVLYYMIPRLCGVRMYKEHWGWLGLAIWNLFLITGMISLLMGYNSGFEVDEFEWPINILRFTALLLVTIQVVVTIFRRKEKKVYVSLWYASAGLIWTLFVLILGNVVLPYGHIYGVDNAAFHGLFIHYSVGLWLTPGGLAMIYYFLPVATKNPLYAHKLSILGFWTLAFCYPFVGTHHYMLSPIPYWTQTIAVVMSILLIIPVWAVTVNFFGTIKGRWGAIASGKDGASYAAKFFMLGAIFYLLGSFQGSMEALRRMQVLTHFSDFAIAHSHFTVLGAMVVWAIGALYYVWPKVTGRELWSYRLASWHLWLTVSGICLMLIGLMAQGFIQDEMLEYGANFVDTVKEMKPWWVSRTVSGALIDIGILLMVINFYKTAWSGESLSRGEIISAPSPWHPAVKIAWYEKPQAIMITAGVLFLMLAVYSQGISLLLEPKTHVETVTSAAVGETIKVAAYTPQELRGRHVYIREGCWYCHSQYIRPLSDEEYRWGPQSQMGEYAYDLPHLLGTRRIGPDLFRVGFKYGTGWHIAHHWNPRNVVPDSIMPRFTWLFNKPSKPGVAPQLNSDGKALMAYLQRLGTDIGDWREAFASTQVDSGLSLHVSSEDRPQLLVLGKHVYERRCIGCHGAKGDGKGPAARFFKIKPRDFTSGIFKFRSTPGSDSLPTDADLFKTITHGLWGTPMPPWYSIPAKNRLAVIQYIKTFSDRWKKVQVEQPIYVPKEPPVTEASISHGKQLFDDNCSVCHGPGAKGDGIASSGLIDEWGHPVRPANFTLPAGEAGGVKLGHDSTHVYQVIMTGVGGTPMPVFQGQLKPDEIWDIIHYEQSLRIKSHEQVLLKADMDVNKLPAARRRMWAELSTSADRGEIETAVVDASPYVANPLVAQAASTHKEIQ